MSRETTRERLMLIHIADAQEAIKRAISVADSPFSDPEYEKYPDGGIGSPLQQYQDRCRKAVIYLDAMSKALELTPRIEK